MMHLILLLVGLTALLLIVRKMVSVELQQKSSTILDEAKHNAIILLWGITIMFLLLFIPYQAWQLAGSSQYWDGAFVMGGSLIASVFICFGYYYAVKGRQLKDTDNIAIK
jgi:hypothetical protein